MASKTIDVDQLLAYGEQQVGKPYVFGTAGPNTFDCSGLISYMYKQFGYSLPHHAASQAQLGQSVAVDNIKRGDLVFSDWGDGPNSHVGIATSPSEILVAPHTGTKVQNEPITANYRSHITAVRRVGPLSTSETAGGPGAGPGGSGAPSTGTVPAPSGSASTSSLTSVWQGTINALESGASSVENVFSGPYKELAKPLQDVGSAAIEMAAIGDKIMSLFLPSNFTRVCAGIGGTALIVTGIFFIARELRHDS